jgi:hypothetical protein
LLSEEGARFNKFDMNIFAEKIKKMSIVSTNSLEKVFSRDMKTSPKSKTVSYKFIFVLGRASGRDLKMSAGIRKSPQKS